MSFLCPNCNSFFLEDYVWWVRNLWRKVRLEATEQAFLIKVFKAHAVPQGLCANLTNALKLRANQQEDGEGLSHNIVKDLGRESGRGLTDGLREFIEVDNKRALDVGAPRRGTGTF